LNIAREKWLRYGCKRLIVFIGLGALAFHIEAQTDNEAYLKSLAGEAEGLSVDSQTEVNPGDANATGEISNAAGTAANAGGLSREEFEKDLQNNYIGSYLFYKRLNDSQKDEVFASYQADPNPDSVREKILQVSKRK
jgi:hypothetical protein